MAKWDSVWNRTFSADYINGKNQNSNIFKSKVALCLSGKPQQLLFLSLFPFLEGTLRCLSRSKIFPLCFFSDKNCSLWCFHVSSENNTNWLPLQENISLEENKWWLLFLYINFMFLSYVSRVDDFNSFFFEKGYGPCLFFFIYSLVLKVGKKQIEVAEKIWFGGYITFYFLYPERNWFCNVSFESFRLRSLHQSQENVCDTKTEHGADWMAPVHKQ